MTYHLVRIVLFIFTSFGCYAQNITGKVLDSKTSEALPFANVFLNNTTIGTVTDTNGEFNLDVKESGNYEVVFSYVGYESYKMKVVVGEEALSIGTIKLVPSEIQLNTIEVSSTRDKEWEKKLKKFKKIFLGDNKLALSCTILNPWVIDFPQDKTGNKFIAKASAPIEINNEGLGYKVVFYLVSFWFDGNGYSITGNARFSELKSMDVKQRTKWEANRIKSYQHSVHYLFKSIIDHRIYGEGFNLYTETAAFKNATSRSSQFYSELGQTMIPYDTTDLVVPDKQKGLYRINLKGRVEVHYRKEKAQIRVYQDVFGPVSWIKLSKDFVLVDRDGFEKNPADVFVSGDMSSSRVAGMLPLDYKPVQVETEDKINFSLYQEQIYVHCDKPYYYPGETIWFKGYVNYATPAWRDSLSRTGYIELVDRTSKSVVASKTVEISNGFFDNDFRLPDTLVAKMYYLRAYTNFNRNFGDENLYVRPLPVYNLTDKVNFDRAMPEKEQSGLFTITLNKKAYGPREKITLTFNVRDDDNNPMLVNLSVAVIDSAQVAPLKFSSSILDGYRIKEIEDYHIKKDLPYSIEYGINFHGRFLNEKNQPEKATLNVFQLNPGNFTMAQSDDQGIFFVDGLSFYDTATFSVQAMRGKDQGYGRGEFVKGEGATIDFKESEYKVNVTKAELPQQRILSEYETPKGTHMLEEVEITSNKIEEEYQADFRAKRTYGKPDYVLKGKDLNIGYGNLLLALPGRIPGLNVRQVSNQGQDTRWVVYLQRGLSINNPKEVLVTINDAIVGGNPADILSTLNPQDIESIELKSGVNVLYGSQGGNGILAIYTTKEYANVKNMQSLSIMKVPGYSRTRKFNAPDYSGPHTDTTKMDYRSTIYWNPNVVTEAKTGTATVSFYAADLPGHYRVEAEGVTQNGEPVRCVYFIMVISN